MHVDLRGWTREPLADGVRLVDPRGAEHGEIAIRVLTGHPRVAGVRRVTDAGEHMFVEDVEHGRVAMIPVAGASLVIAGTCTRDDVRGAFLARLDQLQRALQTGEDPLRVRTTAHRPPRGWRGVRRPYLMRWIADRATIDVHDAIPLESSAAFTSDLLSGGLRNDPLIAPPESYVSVAGLRGILHRTSSGITIDLRDDRFSYRARLEGSTSFEAVFVSVVDSMEPVPRPRQTAIMEVLSWAM